MCTLQMRLASVDPVLDVKCRLHVNGLRGRYQSVSGLTTGLALAGAEVLRYIHDTGVFSFILIRNPQTTP